MRMKIYNAFGIKPTNTYVSAGSDYYVPNIKDEDKSQLALEAFVKSYGVDEQDVKYVYDMFKLVAQPYMSNNITNLVHLFFATYNSELEELKNCDLAKAVFYFLDEYVVYDDNKDVVGVKLAISDTLFINSGIKVALDSVLTYPEVYKGVADTRPVEMLRSLGIGVAGLYVNKSGKGNVGFDVRACLVDEDYSGYVHLSMAYTKDNIDERKAIIFCGDKLTQMMLIPVFHTQYEEVSEDEYNALMIGSQRGDNGFGSSDVKH